MKFQKGKIVHLDQGSPEWDALRAKRFTASEAPAMAGKGKYQSRNDLLKQKATGIVPEVSAHQQRIFDDGHRAEAAARPIAEKIAGEPFSPVVLDDEENGFMASMDGLDMMGEIGFEHKWLSKDLAEQIDAGELEDHYIIQLDQQFALSGAEKILFVGSDGTEENFKYLWIERDESRFKPLLAAWEQFAKDLSQYEAPEPEQPKPEGKAPDALPALSVQVQGMVTASNLKEFEASALAALESINTDLQTDTDFANAEKAVKFCKDVEKRLKATKDQVIGQMASVDEVIRLIDSLDDMYRQKRLGLDKEVKAQKEQRKQEILLNAKQDFDTFLRGLDVCRYMPVQMPDFAGAMKGKRTIASLKGACDDLMAEAKIAANEQAAVIRDNIKHLDEHAGDYWFLFSDFNMVCQKPADDFAAIVKARIADHKEAEQKRLDAEREKIRQEEEEKARREAEQQALKVKQQEQAERQAAEAEMAKAEQERREQYDEGQKVAQVAEQPKPASQAKPSVSATSPKTMARPATDELVEVLANHYGVDTGAVWGWIFEIKTQGAA